MRAAKRCNSHSFMAKNVILWKKILINDPEQPMYKQESLFVESSSF